MARKPVAAAVTIDHDTGEEMDAAPVQFDADEKAPCTALAIAARRDVTELYADGEVRNLLDRIKTEIRSLKTDISTPDGREFIRSTAYQLAKRKTWFDKLGLALTLAERAKIDRVNKERKTWREELTELQAEFRRPLTEWEEKDKNRIADHAAAVDAIEAIARFAEAEPAPATVQSRFELLDKLAAREWDEFAERASFAVAEGRDRLTAALAAAQRREADAAELAELRAQRAERERVDRVKAMVAGLVESPDYGETETVVDLEMRLRWLAGQEQEATEEKWSEFLPAALAAIASERQRAQRLLDAARARERAEQEARERQAADEAREAERVAAAERERAAADELAEANRKATEADAVRKAAHEKALERFRRLAEWPSGKSDVPPTTSEIGFMREHRGELVARDWQEFAEQAAKIDAVVVPLLDQMQQAAEEREEAARTAAQAEADAAEAARQKAAIEADRLAQERQRQREQAEANAAAEARERNLNHRRKINNDAVAKLIEHAGLSDKAAKAAVEAIAKKLVPNVTISY